jgi:MFS family permease
VSGVAKARVFYALALTVGACGWGSFYAFSTRYISQELRGGTPSVMLFNSANWGFTLLAVFASGLAKLLGEKRLVLLGILTGLPILLGGFVKDPVVLAPLLASSALPWAVTWPAVLKAVFSRGGSALGREYAIFTLGSGTGFALGAALSGALYALGGPQLVYLVIALLVSVPYPVYYAYYTTEAVKEAEGVSLRTHSFSLLKYTLVAVCLASLSRELLYAQGPTKISHELDALVQGYGDWVHYALYGLVYSGGAVVSPIVRVLGGRLVDKYGSRIVFIATIASYATLYWLFIKTSGFIPLLLWQTPLYPIQDTAISTHIASLAPEPLRLHGLGLATTFTALGGTLVALALATGITEPNTVGCVVIIASAIATALLLYEKKALSKGKGQGAPD